MDRQKFIAEVCFYSHGQSCRQTAPNLTGGCYRPHFIVKHTADYLGVCFIDGNALELGKPAQALVETLYDGVNYQTLLQPGCAFFIAEGAAIVGQGKVIGLWQE
ncbi:hypothetical protein SOASR032_12110 [Pragia fontium]|uniref:Elongation factor Tu n=1 Tax=Pragia fontium TaxID=82985 RepID=A0ABQ5LGB4_9GAMM|nr:hypothetical protein [Pragia fontium]GKX62642.1 hypothetical protein SOASR032_12110 [Pragia fontium]